MKKTEIQKFASLLRKQEKDYFSPFYYVARLEEEKYLVTNTYVAMLFNQKEFNIFISIWNKYITVPHIDISLLNVDCVLKSIRKEPFSLDNYSIDKMKEISNLSPGDNYNLLHPTEYTHTLKDREYKLWIQKKKVEDNPSPFTTPKTKLVLTFTDIDSIVKNLIGCQKEDSYVFPIFFFDPDTWEIKFIAMPISDTKERKYLDALADKIFEEKEELQ